MLELIDRKAALEKMCELCGYRCEKFEKAMQSTHPDFVSDKCNNYRFLAEQPKVEAAPVRHGRWIPANDVKKWVTSDKLVLCSECEELNSKRSPFCPNCGADMRKEGADNAE